MSDFWETLGEAESRRATQAVMARRDRIIPEQNFLERVIEAATLDTGVGQIARDLSIRFENDGINPPANPDYNPLLDPMIEGYDPEIFIGSTSATETDMRRRLADRNNQSRKLLEDAFWSRLGGNFIDPINLIPVPVARGLGFARGALVGGAGVSAPLALSETVRAMIDPTNPPEEPFLAIAGGAIFGSAIGGLVGGIRPRDIQSAGNRWFDANDDLEAHTRLVERGEEWVEGIQPYVERAKDQSRLDHLKSFVVKGERESFEDFKARLELIAESDDLYSDIVSVSRLHNPDAYVSTYTGIEKIRWSQDPVFMLKNNKFSGALGNEIRRLSDRVAGPLGMITKGALQGIPQAQGVFNKSLLLNTYAAEMRNGLYSSYLKSQGLDVGNLTPGQQVVEGFKDLTPGLSGRTQRYQDYMDDVARVYMAGTKHSDPAIMDGVKAIKKYFDKMGELGVEAGVFGTKRLKKQLAYFDEKRLPRQTEYLRRYVEGDPEAVQDNFVLGLAGRIERDRKIIEDINAKAVRTQDKSTEDITRSFKSEEQRDYFFKVSERLAKNENELSEINRFLRDPEAFLANVSEDFAGVPTILHDNLRSFRARTRLAQRLDDWEKSGDIPMADSMGWGHLPRIWNREAVRQNRDELIEILRDWYGRDGGAATRAEGTVARMLREMDVAALKQTMREALIMKGVDDQSIAVMERRMDEISRRKKPRKLTRDEFRSDQEAELKRLVDTYRVEYGIGGQVDERVAQALADIENIVASGGPEDFGASTSTLARKLDIPSALLVRGEGRTGGIATVDFIETDPELIMRAYHRRMAATIEMANEFGDPTMRNYLDELEADIELQATRAKNDKEVAAIRDEGRKVIQAAVDMRDKTLGVFRIPEDPSSLGNRSVRMLKNFMVMALMGKASVAALADMGRIAMSVGITKGFGGLTNRWGAAKDEFIAAGKQVMEAGEAAEIALHGRFQSMFDLDGYISEMTPFERMVQGGVDKMFVLNGLAPYTDAMKRFSGAIIQSEMIKFSLKWAGDARFVEKNGEFIVQGAAGKLSKDEMLLLTKNGIGFDDAVRISQEFAIHGKRGNALYLANAGAWGDPVLQKKFRTALVQEVNNAVVTPNPNDRLNFMSSPLASLMTQFKSFGLAATRRTMLAGLQQRDAKALHGLLSMVAMGYLVDIVKSPSYDSRDFTSLDRLTQALDYSGATGILFDINNMFEVMSGNQFGIRPMLGVKSFYQDPNLAQRTGQVGGPAASLGFDLINSIVNSEADGSDMARSVRRLLPFNNLIWWSWAIDRIQRSAGEALDDED